MAELCLQQIWGPYLLIDVTGALYVTKNGQKTRDLLFTDFLTIFCDI